jgi:hypothetical protein
VVDEEEVLELEEVELLEEEVEGLGIDDEEEDEDDEELSTHVLLEESAAVPWKI